MKKVRNFNNRVAAILRNFKNQCLTDKDCDPLKWGGFVFMEIWKDIKGFEGCYQISSKGKIKSVRREVKCIQGNRIVGGRELIPKKGIRGYMVITLCKKSKCKIFPIHRLLALHFLENPNNYPVINHKNGIKTDNSLDNLEWCTYSQNIQHAYDTGLQNGPIGVKSGTCKLSEKEVLEIRSRIGESPKKLGEIFGVKGPTIIRIQKRIIWKHL